MAYNGAGVYSLYSPGNPVVTGTTISSSWANNTLNDIATALTLAICKDGQSTTTARVHFAQGASATTLRVGRTTAIASEILSGYSSSVYPAYLWFANTGTTTPALVCRTDAATGATSGEQIEFLAQDSSLVGKITSNGTTTAYATSSDYRLKDVDGPLTGSGDFIDALKPYVGRLKKSGVQAAFFLAHEYQLADPGAVRGEKDGEEEVGDLIDKNGVVVLSGRPSPGNAPLEDGKRWVSTGRAPAYQQMEYASPVWCANVTAELQALRKRCAALEAK